MCHRGPGTCQISEMCLPKASRLHRDSEGKKVMNTEKSTTRSLYRLEKVNGRRRLGKIISSAEALVNKWYNSERV